MHSGLLGGPIPDALSALARILASLHGEDGRVAVAGLASGPADPLDLTEDELRATASVRPGVRLIGEGSLTERLWTRPAASVLGIDAPSVAEASNQLVPFARARISVRLAPGDDARRAVAALVAHLEANAPWGVEVRVRRQEAGEPYEVAATGPFHEDMRLSLAEAWGRRAVDIGTGGTIPFVAAFARGFPDAAILLTGVEDPQGNAHAENESIHLGELERTCLAEALFLGHAARTRPSTHGEG